MNIIRKAQRKARNLNRESLLKPRNKSIEINKTTPLVVTFNPANPSFHKILEKHWHILQLSKNKDAFPKTPLVAYRRPKNMSDNLVRAECKNRKDQHDKQTIPFRQIAPTCKSPWRCKFCPNQNNPDTLRSTSTGREYRVPQKYTCNTRNVIHLITCHKCGKQYVGETYRTFKERMNGHIEYVHRKELGITTGEHYNSPDHTINDMITQVIFILYKEPTREDKERANLELRWIDRMNTFSPIGLNKKGS